MIEVRVPIKSPVIGKVVKRYKTLYKQAKASGEGANYTTAMMWNNINKALCIDGMFLSEADLRKPILSQWDKSGFKVFYHSHWYYAVKLLRTVQNGIIASVVDACYEGQYHNDRTQRPYILKESTLRRIVTEVIKQLFTRKAAGFHLRLFL